MKIFIDARDREMRYAVDELTLFLETYTNAEVLRNGVKAEQRIELRIDSSCKEQAYCIQGDGKTLRIYGATFSAVLCGVYDALAEGGILFEATGHSVPRSFDFAAFMQVNKYIQPKFRLRGVRQHINFPMDISSYTLKEAKAYICSLARMRYNAITFHSYPGQWHEATPSDKKDCAGHFFYGKTHPIPQDDALTASRVQNRVFYCIPEVECLFEDEQARAEYAKYWLNEVMQTAKEVGMEITLSVEIISDDDTTIVDMLRNVCKTYPHIDTLELICEECGGFKGTPGVTRENVNTYLVSAFGEDILDKQGNVPGLPKFLPHQLADALISVKRVVRAVELRSQWLTDLQKKPKLRAGIYVTCADTLRVLRPILRKKLPQGVTLSLLPAHGAVAVAENIRDTGTTADDWQNTMFYSWAEFDGNMFLQQMSTDGIEQLVSMPVSQSSYGASINHWRTAENNLAISYAAEAMITATPASEFYVKYAKKLGIGDEKAFQTICQKLAWLDTYARDNLFNIGFCALNCWLNWCRRGDAIAPRGYPADTQAFVIEKYEDVIEHLRNLLPFARTQQAVALIRLWINRCQTSILHLRALMTLDKILEVYDYEHPHPPTKEKLDKIHDILREAEQYAMEYLHVYGEILPDRGGEGQLISYYETTLVFIRAVATNFNEGDCFVQAEEYDAPPMPDAEVK